MRRAEGGAKIFGVFRVKNHDFTPKNLIFSNFRGGGGVPPLDPPLVRSGKSKDRQYIGKRKRDKATNNGIQNTTQKSNDCAQVLRKGKTLPALLLKIHIQFINLLDKFTSLSLVCSHLTVDTWKYQYYPSTAG